MFKTKIQMISAFVFGVLSTSAFAEIPIFILDEIESEQRMMVVYQTNDLKTEFYTCLKQKFEEEQDSGSHDLKILLEGCKLELRLSTADELKAFAVKLDQYAQSKTNNDKKAATLRNFISAPIIITAVGAGFGAVELKYLSRYSEKLATLTTQNVTDFKTFKSINIIEPLKVFFKTVFRKGFFSNQATVFEYTYFTSAEALAEAQKLQKSNRWTIRSWKAAILTGATATSYTVLKWSYNIAIKKEASQKAVALVTTIQNMSNNELPLEQKQRTSLSVLFRAFHDIGYESWGSLE